MHRGRILCLLAAGALGAVLGGAACNLVLGDHEIFGEDLTSCSDHSDCEDDERCDEYGAEVCRERCDDSPDAGPQCLQGGEPGFRTCDDQMCTEPIGTPCDSDSTSASDYCGGYANRTACVNEDSDGDQTKGYCTASCRESLEDCPPGFVCMGSGELSGQCACAGSTCP